MVAGAADLPAKSPEGETGVEVPRCHNCGAVAVGNFCSECGQTTHVHMPTLFEFLHEFISHHVAFEGTLVASVKRLLFSPGRLTLDYFDGKRARYVAPLRLYLTFNVVFFLAVEIFQAVGLGNIGQDVDARRAVAQAKFSDATAAIEQAGKEIMADPELTPEQRQAAAQKLASLQQYAARAALPDTVQKGGGVPTSNDQKSSASSGTPTPVKPEKNFTFNFGKPVVPAESSAPGSSGAASPVALGSGAVSAGAATSGAPSPGTSGPAAGAPAAASSGLPTGSITLGHVASKGGDDDDDEEDNAESSQRDVRQEVLASARDAADAAAPDETPPAAKPGGLKTDNVTIQKVENSTIPSWVDRYAPIVRRRVDEMGKRTPQENLQHLKENGLHYAPYTLLALLPVCAFLLQMSFIGRHRGYVEHLVAALHGHTFLFIVLLVFVPLSAYSGLLGASWLLLALLHMIWALSRIYGSRGIGLFMRLGVLAVTYGVAMLFATVFAVFFSVLT